eukprot:TRINITY_DN11650_c0_g1_i1.p1 TRINITY_DN11650_c0_g1~~TRINITY_DN11650_c0_g1_i1.p1  ORF type:complete len:152 (+),score=26.50 TRINITY_DN11650_c0_g1_i1:8-463(+)
MTEQAAKPKTNRKKKVPKGFEEIEEVLKTLDEKMKAVESDEGEGKRKVELLWPIFRLHHQKSRYVFEMYKKKKITKEVYDYCLREKIADANLIAKWKKSGYERLCCLRCIQPRDHNYGTTCVCRVPSSKLESGKVVECVHCGCHGCASGDG